MREDFHDELARVNSSLVAMAKAVREAMRQASVALLTGDYPLAQRVAAQDAQVDVLYRLVDERVLQLIARQQPVADDLRSVLTALQAAADLERMGDLAVHIARAALRRHPSIAVSPELVDLFQAMSTVADQLAAKIVVALSDRDEVLAAQLDADDDAMDQLHRRLFQVMLDPEWPLGVEAAVDGALLGRYYERYADHAVNVGRHILFLVIGKADS
ncbi:phosphate signaling complex protein PhoU [Actinoplanes sp. NPDC026619]|uniref:phosphate signaling complex protein PhoU n=1 Tax=Actinoplanes sp. NPDC026619 TaxID=3155798 RepID=UPI00340DDD92